MDYETNKSLPQVLKRIIPNTSHYAIQEFLDPWFIRYDEFEDLWYFGSYKNAKSALDFITAQLLAAELANDDSALDEEDVENDDWMLL